jgi:hypothetical protein
MKAWVKTAIEIGVQVWQLWRSRKKEAPAESPEPERAPVKKYGKQVQ